MSPRGVRVIGWEEEIEGGEGVKAVGEEREEGGEGVRG